MVRANGAGHLGCENQLTSIASGLDGDAGFCLAFQNKVVLVTDAFLETLLYEEALAAFISYDLARITSGNESELRSWAWQGKACSYPAILLALTSCFRARLWFLTIPYLFWWANYSGVDEALGYGGESRPDVHPSLEELGVADGATDQEQVEAVGRAGLGMTDLLEFDNSYRSILYMARAGIHPRWAQYAGQARIARHLENLSHILKSPATESTFLENTDVRDLGA